MNSSVRRLLSGAAIIAVYAVVLLPACMKKEHADGTKVDRGGVNRGFYFWKNNVRGLDSAELRNVRRLHTQKLYVKFFEVDRDSLFGAAPIAKTTACFPDYEKGFPVADSGMAEVMRGMEIIPVVFVKNEVLNNATGYSLGVLADNISFLVSKYYREKTENHNGGFREIQLDCDWTTKTKDAYFLLLKDLKKVSGKTISCTLRLYPYKYPDKMGVPPVDKVTLMCYNLLSPLKNENRNSILDNAELGLYLQHAKKYPLHLDIALPVFSWMQVYQGGRFSGIISSHRLNAAKDLKPLKPLWYEVQRDLEVDELYLREGDRVKAEEVSAPDIQQAIALVKKYVPLDENVTVTLFHLDGDNLRNYSDEELESFYTGFTR